MHRMDASHGRYGKRRVLIVDDHPLVRRGVGSLIALQPDLELCGEAADACEALRMIKATCPHVVVVDLSLGRGHGLELIEQLRQTHKGAKAVVYSMHDEELYAQRALRAGAMAYVPKHEPPERLLEAIREVLAGRISLSPAIAGRLLQSVVGAEPCNGGPLHEFSNRELQVFDLIGQGMATKEIARRLHLSCKTIESHREKIKMKLAVSNGAELNQRAVQWVLERK